MHSVITQAEASQAAQAEVPLGNLGSATVGNLDSVSLGVSPHEEAFHAVTFADAVRECVEDDAMSSVSVVSCGCARVSPCAMQGV